LTSRPPDRALGAGRPTDIPARLLSQIFPAGPARDRENRPARAARSGRAWVATAAPDGLTLLIGNTSVLAVIPAVGGRRL
jgi:hypothetical protein